MNDGSVRTTLGSGHFGYDDGFLGVAWLCVGDGMRKMKRVAEGCMTLCNEGAYSNGGFMVVRWMVKVWMMGWWLLSVGLFCLFMSEDGVG